MSSLYTDFVALYLIHLSISALLHPEWAIRRFFILFTSPL